MNATLPASIDEQPSNGSSATKLTGLSSKVHYGAILHTNLGRNYMEQFAVHHHNGLPKMPAKTIIDINFSC